MIVLAVHNAPTECRCRNVNITINELLKFENKNSRNNILNCNPEIIIFDSDDSFESSVC